MKHKKKIEQLYLQFSKRIFQKVYYIVKDKYLAEEIVHDTFIKAALNLDSVRDFDKIEWWLSRIAANQAYYMLRKTKLTELPISEEVKNDAVDEDLTSNIIKLETKHEIQQALSALPPDDLLLITLHYYDQLPLKDIANIFETPVGTIKSRLFRIRRKLQKTLHKIERVSP
ncbi:MAG: RNA polymerase sigma factor [Dethiobacter sp.]|jgi:RNA polymerase sigma-70 factor (ECF subfamily)|nr:RNA polymerase sigma factor [Dethiobacter sp.]MBS3989988.1 RNA polymerase sigma factor [Dethiobacter sp.]